jgi:glucose-6-phosphate dehydrogenase assembly protein OpcA
MAVANELQELAGWSDPSTDASGIQAALNRIWHEASDSRAASDGQSALPGGIARMRVANLVTYTSTTDDARRLGEQLQDLATRHPIRSILLNATPNSKNESIAAAVRTYCRPSSGRQVCFEHIQISSSEKTGRRLASIVSQLTVHDLPTVLWWAGRRSFTSSTFTSLAPLADLIVLDTAEIEPAMQGFAAIGAGLRRYTERNVVADLNWNRLADWRELIAQFFDREETLHLISEIREIEIAVSPDAGSVISAQPLLLVAWLASCLGWTYVSGRLRNATLRIRMRRGRSFTNIVVATGARRQRTVGAVCSVRIDAGPTDSSQRFLLSADSDSCGISSAEHAPGQSTSRRFSLAERTTADLMAEELDAFGREHALDDALEVAVALAERLRSIPPSRRSEPRSA